MALVTDDTMIVGDGTARSAAMAGWTGARSGLSWSAVIAGALTAIAVSFIVIALGSGIGMELVSPYSSSPSASSMTIIGALWLVFAQAVGFAAGGYVAARLRRPPAGVHTSEVKFRDGANGLVVWAIGVIASVLLLGVVIDKVGSAASSATGTAAVSIASAGAASQTPSLDYFTDALLRPSPQNAGNGGANGSAPGGSASNGAAPSGGDGRAQHAQINRIFLTALSPNGMSDDDHAYLAQVVSAQTGLSQDDAQHRVDDVIARAKQDATQAVETSRKAAAYLSFWTFMSLLFGAACATLGGILGGDLRDEHAIRQAVATSPR